MRNIYIIGLLVASLWSCSGNKDKADAYGNFEAVESIVSAEANGKLQAFNVEEGQVLTAGQKIGYVDTIQLSLQLLKLKAQEKAVFAKKANISAQIRVQEQQLANANSEFERVQNLMKGNAATDKQKDDLENAILLIQRQLDASKTQYQAIAAELSGIEASRLMIKDQIERSMIVNSKSGTVLEKYMEEKELVNMGKSLYKLADLSSLDLRVYLSGKQLQQVKIGQQVKVYIDSNSDEMISLNGTLYWISDQSEFTPKIIQTKEERVNLVYAAKVRVKNNGQLKIGMPAEVRF